MACSVVALNSPSVSGLNELASKGDAIGVGTTGARIRFWGPYWLLPDGGARVAIEVAAGSSG
eukprot:12737889-Alexandrium_andersonii.AAC.1